MSLLVVFLKGYDTAVIERGGSLSGGQKQRIAIARTLISQPKILIFDEATSALDAESELIFKQQLKTMAKGRTVILIAHRLSTLEQADRIVCLEGGTILEEGPPNELKRSGGLFAKLWRQQMGDASHA